MKVYITRKVVDNEYSIITVADNLVAEFEGKHKESILITGTSIQDALLQFASLVKVPDTPPAFYNVRDL